MKKYQVKCVGVTAEMIKGEEPWNNISMDQYDDYVEAQTAEEAIEQIMDWIVEEATCTAEINEAGDMVIFYDEDGEMTGGDAFFTATEIED